MAPRKRGANKRSAASISLLATDADEEQHAASKKAATKSVEPETQDDDSSTTSRKPRKRRRRRRRRRAKPRDVFQHVLGEDIHRHILSYLMCPSRSPVESAKHASELHFDAHREEYMAENPDVTEERARDLLNAQYYGHMTDEERAPWIERSNQDKIRYQKEDADFTTPKKLREAVKTLCLVSKYWRQVVGESMNSNAPQHIVSPLELYELKCHARKISLSYVCHIFLNDLREMWGEKFIVDNAMEQPLSLDILLLHFEDVGFVNLIKEEYMKFLVLKSIEKMGREHGIDDSNETSLIWREPCRPCKIIDIFWRAHMSSPKKYLYDCFRLVDGLESGDGLMLIDRITGHGTHDDYLKKKDAMFEFEKQLPRMNSYDRQCGRQLVDVDELLFTESFDINKIAEDILGGEPAWGLHDYNSDAPARPQRW